MSTVSTVSLTENPPLPDSTLFFKQLPALNVAPLWLQLNHLLSKEPDPVAIPAIWRYAEIRPYLMTAGEVVSAEEAERRVLMLINPALEAPCTTDTIYGGLQLVKPGEVAPAHRHVASAMRFIIEGSRGFTAVDGERITMERGDIILTPSWKWHDHGNDGDEPVIWLDGLDLPVFKLLKLNFAAGYPQPQYPSQEVKQSDQVHKWAPVRDALKHASGPYARFLYTDKQGSHLSQTLSAQAERISAETSSPESQETVSFMYHVVEGKGHSAILSPGRNNPEIIKWSSKDTFAVPAWSKISHTCTSPNTDAFLVAINDRPMVEALGLWKDSTSFSVSAE